MKTEAGEPDATESPAWRGPAAAALVLFFLAGSFASASGMHGCPQHHYHAPSPEAQAHRNVDAGAAAAAGRGVGDARGGAAHGPRDVPGPAGGREEPAGPTCTCLGDCQAGGPSALHEPPLRAVPGSEHQARVGPAADGGVRPEPHPDYFLPYPLGPPLA